MPPLGHQYTQLLEAPKPIPLIPCCNTEVNTIKQLCYQWTSSRVAEEDGHAHVSAYVCIETTATLSEKIKPGPFESVPLV